MICSSCRQSFEPQGAPPLDARCSGCRAIDEARVTRLAPPPSPPAALGPEARVRSTPAGLPATSAPQAADPTSRLTSARGSERITDPEHPGARLGLTEQAGDLARPAHASRPEDRATGPAPAGVPPGGETGGLDRRPVGVDIEVDFRGTVATPARMLPALSDGASFGRWVLIRALGAGGMGAVWQAWDTELDRAVAIKVMKLEDAAGEATARFLREARLSARLRHPGIVGVFDVGTVNGRAYLAMDYVDGVSLEQEIEQTRTVTMPEPKVRAQRLRQRIGLLAEVAEAVAHAHAQGIVHRDLKPANVLIAKNGKPLVTDFGLAKEFAASTERERSDLVTRQGQAVGTPAYMSPEQATGDHAAIGPHTDVWALGVMLYELLTDTLPFPKPSLVSILHAIVDEEPARPEAIAAGVPHDLENVCLRALEKEESARYRTAAEFAAELRLWLAGERVSATVRPASVRIARWVRRRRASVLPIIAALLVLGTAFAWVAWERRHAGERVQTLLAEVVRLARGFEDEAYRTRMPQESLIALAAQPLGPLEEAIRLDPANGLAHAWRGRVNRVLRRNAEADADLDRACALAPNNVATHLLRGLDRIERYAQARGLPGAVYGSRGMKLVPARAETDAESALRESGLADLAIAAGGGKAAGAGGAGAIGDAAGAAAGTGGIGEAAGAGPGGIAEAAGSGSLADELRLGRASAAVWSGRPGGCAEALAILGDQTGPAADRLRGTALYLLGRFDEAVAGLDAALERWPLHAATRSQRAIARHAAGLGGHLRGKDSDAAFSGSISDYTVLLETFPGDSDLWNGRATSWSAKSQSQAARGGDPRASLRHAIDDYAESARLAPGLPSAWANAAGAWRRLGEAESERGGDPLPAWRTAIDLCTRTIEKNASWSTAWNNRAMARQTMARRETLRGVDMREELREAIRDFDQALRLSPRDALLIDNRALAWITLAEAEQRLGGDPAAALTSAIEGATRALELDPDFVSALTHRASAASALGDREATQGRDPRERYAAAITDLTAALAANPEYAIGYNNRGNLRMAQARWEGATAVDSRSTIRQAIEDFARAMKSNPAYLDAVHNRGNAWMQFGEAELRAGADPSASLARSAEDYTEVLRRNPRYHMSAFARGLLRRTEGDFAAARGQDPRPGYTQAEADFGLTIELSPEFADAYHSRGAVRIQMARLPGAGGFDPQAAVLGALADFSEVVKRRPRWPESLNGRAAAWIDLGNLQRDRGQDPCGPYAKAIADFTTLTEWAPENADAWGNRGKARRLLALGQVGTGRDARETLRQAAADLDIALKHAPGSTSWLDLRGQVWLIRAQLLQNAGTDASAEYARAEADLEAAVERGMPGSLSNLVTVYRRQGRNDEAIQALEELARRVPAQAAWARAQIEEIRGGK